MKAGEIHVDEELAAVMLEDLVETAEVGGWRQYEVANFARDGRVARSRHDEGGRPGARCRRMDWIRGFPDSPAGTT